MLILMIQFSDFQSRLQVTACEIGIDEHASCNLSHYSRYIASVCCQLQIYKAVTRHGIWFLGTAAGNPYIVFILRPSYIWLPVTDIYGMKVIRHAGVERASSGIQPYA